MVTPCLVTPAASSFVVPSTLEDQIVMLIGSLTTSYFYQPLEDAWITGSSPALAGTFQAGVSGCHHPNGPTGTCQTGTTASILKTTLSLAIGLSGYKGRITGGTGAGQDFIIDGNTTGSNSQLYLRSALAVAPDTSSTYILFTGRFWLISSGTTGTSTFKFFDWATQAYDTTPTATLGVA